MIDNCLSDAKVTRVACGEIVAQVLRCRRNRPRSQSPLHFDIRIIWQIQSEK